MIPIIILIVLFYPIHPTQSKILPYPSENLPWVSIGAQPPQLQNMNSNSFRRNQTQFILKPIPQKFAKDLIPIPIRQVLSNQLRIRRKADTSCSGFDNLIGDLGVVSYGLGLVGTLLGVFTLLVSLVTQTQTILSTFMVGLPSSWITLDQFYGSLWGIPSDVQNLIGLFGLLDTIINLTFATPVGNFVNLVDTIGALVSGISLFFGLIATFPTTLIFVMEEFLEKDPKAIFASYGCSE